MPRSKKAVVRRPRVGIGAIPTDSFEKAKFNIHYELSPKDGGQILKDYLQTIVKDKKEMSNILRLSEWKFTMPSHFIAAAFWKMRDLPCGEREMSYIAGLGTYVASLREDAAELRAEEKKIEVKRLSPADMLKRKVNRTVMVNLDELEDAWIDGKKEEIDLYVLFQKHGLKGNAVSMVLPTVEAWLSDYSDAYNKTCEQAMEGYAHLSRAELKRRVKACETMLADLNRVKESSAATRAPRVKKSKSVTSQTKNLKYKKQDNEFKLTSVNPIAIVGAMRLLTFNCKTRVITEYISEHPDGFEVSGTSLKRFDVELSRSKKLRKPEEFLKNVNKTPKQFAKEFDALTTKTGVPNGRMNEETILLRVK